MNKIYLAADSSADLFALPGAEFTSVPLTIHNGMQFVDDENLDVAAMMEHMSQVNEKTTTSCPSPGAFLEAFPEQGDVLCLTITSGLSGSYGSACIAAEEYEAAHPGCRCTVVDTLTAGPQITLMLRRLAEDVQEGMDYDALCAAALRYKEETGLLFTLETMENLAKNGRVSPLVAKAAGLLGIRVVGKASREGKLELLEKPRGKEKMLKTLLLQLEQEGCKGGRVEIHHCESEATAHELRERILARWPSAQVTVAPCHGLCSFYAQRGGLLIGFEK